MVTHNVITGEGGLSDDVRYCVLKRRRGTDTVCREEQRRGRLLQRCDHGGDRTQESPESKMNRLSTEGNLMD